MARASKVALDTSAYSHLRVGHERVVELIASAQVVYVPTIVLGELEAGFVLGSRYRDNSQVLEEFLREPSVVVRPVSEEASRIYGRLFASLRRAGTPLPVNDIWIAATTMEVAASLVTFDRDFLNIRDLRTELLT